MLTQKKLIPSRFHVSSKIPKCIFKTFETIETTYRDSIEDKQEKTASDGLIMYIGDLKAVVRRVTVSKKPLQRIKQDD